MFISFRVARFEEEEFKLGRNYVLGGEKECVFNNRSSQAESVTRSIFKECLTDLNSEILRSL